MLALLSPAKRLDFSPQAITDAWTLPALLDESRELMRVTRALSPEAIGELMHISPELAALNAERYRALGTELGPDNAKQAVLAFMGQAYLGLDAASLSEADLAFAQDHLGILSGLYGYLRPLDLIQPHRLEMGTRLATERGATLYAFWGDRIRDRVAAQLAASGDRVLVNLASAEYFKAVRAGALDARIVTPVFQDTKGGKSRVLAVFAKKARGMMVRYILRERITEVERLKDFSAGGYRFREDRSEGDRWVFERPQPPKKGR